MSRTRRSLAGTSPRFLSQIGRFGPGHVWERDYFKSCSRISDIHRMICAICLSSPPHREQGALEYLNKLVSDSRAFGHRLRALQLHFNVLKGNHLISAPAKQPPRLLDCASDAYS